MGLVEIIVAATVAAIGALSLLLKSARSDKKLAENERDNAIAMAVGAQKRVEAHEKRNEIENEIAMGDIPNVDDGMRDPYDRDART